MAVSDWRELLGKVDLVSVCSPAVTHAEIVRAFLNAGAHVLVEKPIATTIEEANDLVVLAAKTGRVLTVGHQERFVFARTGLLDQTETPLEIQCWRRGPWTGRGDDVSAVLDLMIHDLDLVHTLVDSPVVACEGPRLIQYGPHADEVWPPSHLPTAPWRGWTPAASPRPASAASAPSMPMAWWRSIFSPAKVVNTTPRPLAALEMGDPLGDVGGRLRRRRPRGSEPLVGRTGPPRRWRPRCLIDEAVEAWHAGMRCPPLLPRRRRRPVRAGFSGFSRQNALNSRP